MALKILQQYENEWKIVTFLKPIAFETIATPSFSPLSDNSVTFRFEACHQKVKPIKNSRSVSLFKLKLVKLNSACISSSLEVTIIVKVYYSDGCFLKECRSKPFLNVNNMSDVVFPDSVQELHYSSNCVATSTEARFRSRYSAANVEPNDLSETNFSETLIIKCKMIFYDSNQISHFMPCIEMHSSNKYLDFINNFKSVYESDVLSDFVFKVGDKSFPAHKIILAAHSPVFMKMMAHDFLESKTNSVTITDATPEIFHLFLKSLYSGEIEDKSWDSLKELYYLADKYDVGFLKNECTETAISILSVDLACEILIFACNYSHSRLKEAAKHFAIQHIQEIVSREDWKELVTAHPLIGYEVTIDFIPKEK